MSLSQLQKPSLIRSRSVAIFLAALVVIVAAIAGGVPFPASVVLGGALGFAAGRATKQATGLLAVCGGVAAAYPAALALGLFAYLGENWVIALAMLLAATLAGWLVGRATDGSTVN